MKSTLHRDKVSLPRLTVVFIKRYQTKTMKKKLDLIGEMFIWNTLVYIYFFGISTEQEIFIHLKSKLVSGGIVRLFFSMYRYHKKCKISLIRFSSVRCPLAREKMTRTIVKETSWLPYWTSSWLVTKRRTDVSIGRWKRSAVKRSRECSASLKPMQNSTFNPWEVDENDKEITRLSCITPRLIVIFY